LGAPTAGSVHWIEDMKHVAGQEIVDDPARGAEAYLQMRERASAR